jgi:uncharacterized protein (TIGR03067 family)
VFDLPQEEAPPPKPKGQRAQRDDEHRRGRQKAAGGGSGAVIVVCVGLGALLLVGVAVGGYYAYRSFRTPQDAARNEPPATEGQPAEQPGGTLPALSAKGLEGVYLLVGTEREGIVVAEPDLAKLPQSERMVRITADKIYMTAAKEEGASYKIDGLKNPPQIDMLTKNESGKEEKLYGIYRVDGDRLTICAIESDRPTDRPKEFKTAAGDKTMILVLKK